MALTVSQALVAKMSLDQTDFQSGLKKSVRSADATNEKMKAGFKKATVAVAALTAATVVLGIKLLNAGAAAVATRSRFETVFGASTAAVDRFNQEFGKISGLSKQAFEDTIATTAAIAQGMGFAQKASADFAIEITKVAGDLASFNGLRTEEVALAVNSALTGERESMKRLGIVILETDVQTKAFEQTGKTVAKTLTQQEKATATLALITERAGVAMGDLSRTSSDTDNVIKQLTAAWTNLRDAIGTFLAESPAVNAFLGQIRDIMQQIVVVMGAGSPAVADAATQVGLLIGNAMGVGILKGLKAFIDAVTLIDKVPFAGDFLESLNPIVAGIDLLTGVAEENVANLSIVLKDIVADANDAAAAITQTAAAASTVGAAGSGGDFVTGSTVSQRQLETLRQQLTVSEQIAQSFADMGIAMIPIITQSEFAALTFDEWGNRINENELFVRNLGQALELIPPVELNIVEGTRLITDQNEAWRNKVVEVKDVISDTVSGPINDMIIRGKAFGDVVDGLRDRILESIVSALVEAVVQATILKKVTESINPAGAAGNTVGGVIGAVGSFFGGFFRDGGMIPSAATGLSLTPSVVGRVPRTSDGGIPIIAHPGEAVITKRAVRDLGGPRAIDQINARSRGVEPVAAGMTIENLNVSLPNVTDIRTFRRELPAMLADIQRKGR